MDFMWLPLSRAGEGKESARKRRHTNALLIPIHTYMCAQVPEGALIEMLLCCNCGNFALKLRLTAADATTTTASAKKRIKKRMQ